jgi:hypothetical protein
MPEEEQGRQEDEELQEESLEDLDAPPEQGEDVKGGVASSDPFVSRCGGG